MIDELLLLSRVARAELHREQIDLSELAREIAAGLQTAEPERQVEFAIADGLAAKGDREVARTVLENLLGNAWKFTSTREHARIESPAASTMTAASSSCTMTASGSTWSMPASCSRPSSDCTERTSSPGPGSD